MPGFWQHFEGNFGDQPEAAVTAGHQARQVVAGDVFHHLATEAQQLALPCDDPRAEHEIAHRTGPRAPWPGQPAGDHAADGGAVAEGRWLAGQHLLRGVQYLRQLRQRCAATGGDHQFSRVVTDDAPVRAGVENFPGRGAAEKGFAVGTLDAQRRGVFQRLIDLFQQ
ncbi:hypothetical protein D3C85_874760 [compost metagenome]